jgi:predicted nucleic acid-binding protein
VARIILLDAGVLGLACSSPSLPDVADCRAWIVGLQGSGALVAVPAVVDYEVRREVTRLGATSKARRLDALRASLWAVDVSAAAWRRAADFWAHVRRAGVPTADPEALDADAILAAVAATIGGIGDLVTIATTNIGHLARFPGVDARRWRDIA